MANRQFTLTEQQVAELNRAHDGNKDGPTRTRYQAVRLSGSGYRVSAIMEITGCSRSAFMHWCRIYREQGVAGLGKRVGGNHRSLTPTQIADLERRLHQYTPRDLFSNSEPYWTVSELQRAVEHWYGVTYQSATSYYTLFHRLGFSRQRPAKSYKSRRETAVRDFEEQVETLPDPVHSGLGVAPDRVVKNSWIPSKTLQRP